jgi:MerR family transcriptional regulator, light-induced transcriptional regulator
VWVSRKSAPREIMGLIFDISSDQQRRAFAERAVLRYWLRQPGVAERYGEKGRQRCVEDMLYTLVYLEAATKIGSMELFRNYITWLRSIFICFNIDVDDLIGTLQNLQEIFVERGDAVQAEYLQDSLGLLDSMEDVPPYQLEEGNPFKVMAKDYLKRLLAQDQAGATDLIFNAADAGIPILNLYMNVLQPTLHEVGRLWQINRVSIPQEHYFTAATKTIMSQLYPYIHQRTSNGRRLIATCIDGELHEIGIRMVCDVFTMNGWEAVYLGASIPVSDIVTLVEVEKPEILALSVTIAPNLPKASDLIAAIRANPGCAATKIMVGGYPFNSCPGLWRQIGADAYARDAASAVSWANLRFAQSA